MAERKECGGHSLVVHHWKATGEAGQVTGCGTRDTSPVVSQWEEVFDPLSGYSSGQLEEFLVSLSRILLRLNEGINIFRNFSVLTGDYLI